MSYSGRVFSFDHNFADDIIERLSWLTDVLPHRDGSEQRRQVRPYPRRELEYSILTTSANERNRLDNFIWSSQQDAVLIPIFTDGQYLAAQANSAQDEVVIDTATYDFDVDQFVLLWRSSTNYESVQIAEVHSDHLVLVENLISTWTAGTSVFPARIGRISAKIDGQKSNNDSRDYRVTCQIDESSPSVNRIASLSPQQYLGTDIYQLDSDFSETLSFAYSHELTLLDQQTGIVGLDSGTKARPYILLTHNEMLLNRSEISNWLGFLQRRQGRRIPFFLPTWENDFEPVLFTFGGINYTANGYANLINVAGGRKDIVIICDQATISYPAGTLSPRRITAASDLGGGVESLAVSMSDFSSGEYTKTRVSFLRYCRCESDVIELSWKSGCVARSSVVLRESWQLPS